MQFATTPASDADRDPVTHVVAGKASHITDAIVVRRLLPTTALRAVGPFVFLDHMGPLALPPGRGMDVPPHPHIGLATVTYLFDGELLHRDSLGTAQVIRPGAINWMTAGRGIVHSERTPAEARPAGARLHGLQSWVALPADLAETDPAFEHVAADAIPEFVRDGVRMRVLAGAAFGVASPVRVPSPLFYVEARFALGAACTLAAATAPEERAVYVVGGAIRCGDVEHPAGTLVALRGDAVTRLSAPEPAHVVLLGGAPLDGRRHVHWNFVATTRERIERARLDWQERRFPVVPGDDVEFVPLP